MAATSGVLVAFGWRGASIQAPFVFLGRHLGGFDTSIYPQGTVVLAGFLLHAAWTMAWCVAFAFIAPVLRGWSSRIPAVLLVALLAYNVSAGLIGSALQTSGLGGARWVFLHVVLALALHLGTPFAPERK